MNENIKILVAEDEADIRQLLSMHLKRAGYAVEEAADGKEALLKIKAQKYSLYILDWMLPETSGIEILAEIRQQKISAPILMCTAKSANEDIVIGLEKGADDYLVKPFELTVLLARVKALLRRAELQRPAKTDHLTLGHIQIDEEAHKVSDGVSEIHLTPYEFKLLASLARHKGKVLTREKLIAEVQGDGVAVVERAIDTHIFGLRKKLGKSADHIETVRGIGYRISAND